MSPRCHARPLVCSRHAIPLSAQGASRHGYLPPAATSHLPRPGSPWPSPRPPRRPPCRPTPPRSRRSSASRPPWSSSRKPSRSPGRGRCNRSSSPASTPTAPCRDLTPFCAIAAEAADVAALGDGFVTPKKNGTTTLVVKAGGQTAKVPVVVKDFDKPQPVSFRHEVIAALNVGGCNAGACHGTPSGKNGFKLSLRGLRSRRRLPHADPRRVRPPHRPRRPRRQPDAPQRRWAGCRTKAACASAPTPCPRGPSAPGWPKGLQDDPATAPAPQGDQILPGARVLKAPARWQQLAVLANFADGSVPRRDAPDRLQQQRHRRRRRERQRPGRVPPGRRGRHPVPLPRHHGRPCA